MQIIVLWTGDLGLTGILFQLEIQILFLILARSELILAGSKIFLTLLLLIFFT